MKKLLSLILAGTMVLSLSAPAFAAEAETANKGTANQESGNSASIDVKGTYLSELKSDEIISVVVAWEDMNFIYYSSQEGTWKPSDHTYDGDKGATWNKTTSDITVTNHSNVAVMADLYYKQSVDSVSGNLSNATLDLESAAQDQYMGDSAGNAPDATSTFTIGGTMDSSSSEALGTITVSLSKDDGVEWTRVSTFDELSKALNSGGNVKLANDITADESLYIDSAFNLNLNGKTLTMRQLRANGDGAVVSIFNGKMINKTTNSAVYACCKELTIDNCTLTTEGNYYALLTGSGCNVTVKNTFLNDGVCVGEGTFTAVENVTINTKIVVKKTGKSKAIFGFDPTSAWVGSQSYLQYLKDNGDGTWTMEM